MEPHTVSRLVGSPPGYVGHDEGAQLVDAVRKRPFCVLLLDEIEKAHPQVLNLFLQVFYAGRLTDTRGRTADFRNTIILMTSNLGAADAAIMSAVSEFATSGEVTLVRPNGTLLQPRWQASGGTLSSDTGAQTDWTVPTEGGALTVTLIVSDGVLRIGQELRVQAAAQAAP